MKGGEWGEEERLHVPEFSGRIGTRNPLCISIGSVRERERGREGERERGREGEGERERGREGEGLRVLGAGL